MADAFETHTATTFVECADLIQWFVERGKAGDRIAIAFKPRSKKIAFATKDDAWVVDFKSIPVAAQLIARQLMSGAGFRLDFRKTSEDLPELVKWLSDACSLSVTNVLQELEPKLEGDLHMAAYCIDQAVTPHKKFLKVEHDAYEVALMLPQYEYNIIPFYAKIGLPLSRCLAETALLKPESTDWWITYPMLWARVLAYETSDPTLQWAFTQSRDVCETVGAMFQAGPEYGRLVLCWAACGMDIYSFKARFKTETLPDNLEDWNLEIRRHLPNMVLGIEEMKAHYVENKGVKTRYQRFLRPGQRASEAVCHIVLGTAEDIAAVAAVACWTNRAGRGTLIKDIAGGAGSESVRISGTVEKREQGTWIRVLSELAELGGPLGPVNLNPIVTIP